MTGTQFGRYIIKRELGSGGMASVYLAYDPTFERDVALKVLPHYFLHDSTFLERFSHEAKIIAKLEHYAIVPVYDYGEEQGQPYLTMRLMTGGSLAERLAQGPLSLAETNKIMQSICAALDKAHTNQILHRDIKPANILFDSDEKAYLADFGIARLISGTQTATLAGTPKYMAPEQMHGKGLDARTDVYQMGIVLFEMLTGKVPFKADTPFGLLHEHAYTPIPSIRQINDTLPLGCEAVIKRAIAKDTTERFASTKELAEAFALALQPKSVPVKESVGRTIRSAWLQPFLAVLMASVFSITILIAFIVFGIGPIQTSESPSLLMSLSPSRSTITPTTVSPQSETVNAATVSPTATSTMTPTAIPQPKPFDKDTYGIVLVSESALDETRTFMAGTESNFKSVLVETRAVDEFAIQTGFIQAGESLEKMAAAQKARAAFLILLSHEGDTSSIIIQSYFSGLSGEPLRSLQKTSDAFLLPFEQSSLAKASVTLADRLGATVNAAIGYDAIHKGKYEECSRRFTSLLHLVERLDLSFNRVPATHATLAQCQHMLGRYEEAKENYEQAITINPNYAVAYFGLGNYWYAKEDDEKAKQYYEEAIQKAEIDPLSSVVNVARAYAGLGNLALANSEFGEAIKAFSQAIELEPEYPSYYLYRANAKMAAGLQDDVRTDLELCVDLATTVEPVQSDYFRQIEQECAEFLASLGTEVESQGEAIVGSELTALWAGPSILDVTIRTLEEGEVLTIVSRNESSTWLEVITEYDERGWVNTEVVQVNSELSTIPIATATPSAQP